MDTASDYGSEEWEFKSLRAHHKLSAVRSTDRTFDFGSINRGSNPLPRTKTFGGCHGNKFSIR